MQVENSRMIYRGSDELARVYRGDHVIVWEPGSGNPYDTRYLTLSVLDITGRTNPEGVTETVSGTKMISFIKFYDVRGTTGETTLDIEFSVNGGPWISYSAATEAQKTVVDGDIIRFRGNNTSYSDTSDTDTLKWYHHSLRISNSFYNVSGNILSMAYGDNFVGMSLSGTTNAFRYLFGKDWTEWYVSETGYCNSARNLRLLSTDDHSYQFLFNGQRLMLSGPSELPCMDLSEGCYSYMFKECALMTEAPSILPATTLANGCYEYMFEECHSLTEAPVLPATTMANSAYTGMFHYCTSLEVAPELPATVLAPYCYAYMFNNCHSLTSSPVLPATYLTQYCYRYMFAFCESLNYIKCLAEYNLGGTATTENWVYDVASAGTFVEAENTYFTWTIGDNGIPTDWVYRRSIPHEDEYMTLDIISGGTLQFTSIANIDYQTTTQPYAKVQASVNGGPWTTDDPLFRFNVNAGDKVRVKGEYTQRPWDGLVRMGPGFSGSTCIFNVYGNALSMVYGDNFTGQTSVIGITDAFAHMFEQTNVVSAENLVLPDGYYPSWTMFETFFGCSMLTTAPVIRATSAAQVAFTETFYFCQNLTYIKCLLDSTSGVGFNRWVTGVPQSGTFVKKSGVSYQSGENGIPQWWTVQDI